MLTKRAAARTAPARRDLRGAILRAARSLHGRHGADGVTARAVAQAVGVSATALYLHFQGVDDILEHLRMEGHELLASYLRDAKGKTALERIRAMGRAYYRFGLEHEGHFDLMFHSRPGASRKRETVQREMFTLLILRDVVAAGMASGELRRDLDVTVVTNALWAEIHGVTALMTTGLLVETSAGHADEVLDAVLDGTLRWLTPERTAAR